MAASMVMMRAPLTAPSAALHFSPGCLIRSEEEVQALQ